MTSKTISSRRAGVLAAAIGVALAATPVLAGTATAQGQGTSARAGEVLRWAGSDRYAASANISRESYDANISVAFIASGEIYTDALSGAPVAGRDRGPILLVRRDSIPDSIAAELTRLNPAKIVIFGGEASVSREVRNELRGYTDGEVDRWAGPTRYSASAKISLEAGFQPGINYVYIASGEVFPDALSGAPVAGMTPGPTLLVESDNIPGAIRSELRRLEPKGIRVLGGENTITPDLYASLTEYTSGAVSRWSGDDRFDTSAVISELAFPNPPVTRVFVASGRVFADALSGAPVAGRGRSPVLLVDTNSIPGSVAAELNRLNPTQIIILGGPATVSPAVEADLAQYVQ